MALDTLVIRCFQYFYRAIINELVDFEYNKQSLLEYFKIIELISNDFSKGITTDKKTLITKQKSVLDIFILNYKKAMEIDNQIKLIKKANHNLNILTNDLLVNKIKIVFKNYSIPEMNVSVEKLVKIRNKLLAHTSSKDIVLSSKEINAFEHYARRMIFEYILHKYSTDEYSMKILEGKIFRDGGYRVAAKFPTQHFVVK